MSDPSITTVFFDYGGVIADEGFQNGLRGLAREQGLNGEAMLQVAKAAIYDSGFILGWGTEGEFWRLMRLGSGLRGSDDDLRDRVLRGFLLRPWMIDRVQRLRARGLITGILSDQTHWLDWLNEREAFFHHFDHVFNSYHLGKGKRDTELFQDIAAQLALSPGEILFIDDMKSNVERARAAGWRAIRYLDKASFLAELDGILPETGPET